MPLFGLIQPSVALKGAQQHILLRYARQIREYHPDVGDTYHRLINRHPSQSMVCNFISQVVDVWAQNTQMPAITSIDLDTPILVREKNSYADIAKRSQQLANFLASRGVHQGSAVALMLGQQTAWWHGLAGLWRRGLAAVPCPRLLTAEDMRYRINELGIQSVLTTPEQQEKIDAIKHDCPSLKVLLTTGASDRAWHSLNDIFQNEPIIMISSEVVTTTEDPCIYLFTSGTTGQPKAVLHNHDYPFFSLANRSSLDASDPE